MATGFYLSEEKMKLLNDLLDERNPRWTKKTTSHSQRPQTFTAPEVFLCQAPDDDGEDNGIDALIPAGDDDYDHPGSAMCAVCQIVPSIADGQDHDLIPIEDGIKQVFNYSKTAIAKADFFLAAKDKFGNWVAVQSNNVIIAWTTTTAAVAKTDSTFDVKLVVPFDGSTWTGDGAGTGAPYLTVQNSPDAFAIDSGIKGKIIACVVNGELEWHPLDFPCPA